MSAQDRIFRCLVRARTFPTLSDSFSYPLRPFAHLHYSFTTAPRLPQSLSHLPLLLSPPIAPIFSLSLPFPLSAFSYFRRPLSFPRFPRVQPRYRTVASVPPYLISDRRRSHTRHTACVPWEPFAPLSHACSTFPTDRENSLTLAPLFVTFHCGHALLFSGHGHASKQYIRRAPCTVVSSDSI